MGTTTTNLSLYKPDVGETGWGTLVDANFDTLDSRTVHYLSYDTTGATNAGPALQAAYDAGERNIVIPPGIFYANSPVFFDDGNADSRILLSCYGVRFKAGTGLATTTEFESVCTGYSRPTGCKWFLFPGTNRAGLSAGNVNCGANITAGTYLSRIPVNPKLVVMGGAWSANSITKYNAGFVFANRGGATVLRDCDLSSARTLLSWADYVDGHAMYSCSAWGEAVMDSTYDSWLWSGGGSGDAVEIINCKVDNYIGVAWMANCSTAHISGTVGGGFYFNTCHGISLVNCHQEANADITATLRNSFTIIDSDVTISDSTCYTTDSLSTNGTVYINDSGGEGAGSHVELRNCNFRDWITTTDPSGGWSIYINKLGNPSRIRVRSCMQSISTSGTFYYAWGRSGFKITGNASNESTLAAALVQGRDLIASGDFDIVKYGTSTIGAGQDQAIPIVVRNIGNNADLRTTRVHAIPTFYDAETSLNGTGTLTNGQLYSYTAAICNTLPDSSIQYGQAPSEWTETPGASGVNGFEIYTPTAAHGATLVLWRKTGTGAVTAPDRYVVIPIVGATTRFVDMGVNVNKWPWISTSVPVPSSVAATNHTLATLYLGTTVIS